VEAAHVGVGLLEPGMLAAGEGEVADDVQAVPTARSPAGHDADDDLWHEPDQPVHLHDVQAAAACRVNSLGRRAGRIPVAVAATDALITSGAEGPASVLRRRAVAGEQHAAHIAGHPRV